jgi:hypothetical protein
VIRAQLQQEIILRSVDRVGVLAEVTRALSEWGINLLSVRVYAIEEEAFLHLVTNSQSYAMDALREAGYEIGERDVVVLELPHHPGFLRRVSEALARKDISIDDLHVSVTEDAKTGIVVMACTNNAHAIQMLRSD